MNLEPFKDLLRERCGLEFNGIAEPPLEQALLARTGLRSAPSAGNYLDLLKKDEHEFYELVSLLTINETYFFREPAQIDFFAKVLAHRLCTSRPQQEPLYILSAGCSTGEEPYSLAMALLEELGEVRAGRFRILAGDIDQEALEKARRGHYTEYSFRNLETRMRQRYFEPLGCGDLWQIRGNVRSLVEFRHLNLFDAPSAWDTQCFDAIFFRNVSIYFGVEKRRDIQKLFSRILHPAGLLMTGIAETLANDLGIFRLVEEDGLFYFAQGSRGEGPPLMLGGQGCVDKDAATTVRADYQAAVPVTHAGSATPGRHQASPPHVSRPPDFPALMLLIREKNLDEALAHLEHALLANPRNPDCLILAAWCHLQKRDFVRTSDLACRVLESRAWSVDACVILGLAARQQDKGEEAVKWFRQAVYDRNSCWPAHYWLADLYRTAGTVEKARRSYRAVLQLLGSGTNPSSGLDLLPLDLPVTEVRFLCEHQLSKMPLMREANHGA